MSETLNNRVHGTNEGLTCGVPGIGRRQGGVVLLVVLFVVMAITVLSLGFVASSDVELAAGQNMSTVTQLGYLAESGLEHAKGLIVSPQDISSEYWAGGNGLQLATGSNYYDVAVVRDDSDLTDRCNYTIDCNAYRIFNGEQRGLVELTASLRLDPCIAFWAGQDATVSQQYTVNGDVYCNGDLRNLGVINGDVFSAGQCYGSDPQGSTSESVASAPVAWPDIAVSDYYPSYYVGSNGYLAENFSGAGPYEPTASNPGGVVYSSSLSLSGSTTIDGTLVVGSGLEVSGTNNVVTSLRDYPAVVVGGDVTISSGSLEVNGLMVVMGDIILLSQDVSLDVVGGLYVKGRIREQASDSSGNSFDPTLYNGPTWQPSGGQIGGAMSFDGTDDTVEITDTAVQTALNGLSGITLSLWVKSDVTSQDRDILFAETPGSGADDNLGIRYDRYGAFGGGSRGIKASIRTSGGSTQIESSSKVQTTAWQHLALTWQNDPNDPNQSRLKLYIDGLLDSLRYDMGPTTGVVSGVQKLTLGCGTKGAYWDGMIDDVRIYNRALSDAEISDVKAGATTVPGLILFWKFDEAGADIDVTAAPCKTAIRVWNTYGQIKEEWQQAGGAFFKSVKGREM